MNTKRSGSGVRYSIAENVIIVSTEQIRNDNVVADTNKARKDFIGYAKKNFPKFVINANTGEKIDISRNGLDKFLSGNISYEKYASGFAIPKLIETAEKVGEAVNKKGKDGIVGYEYYYNTLKIDDVEFSAHIRVRNTDSGDKYYGHTISKNVVDIEIEPMARAADNSDKSVDAVSSTIDISIPQSTNDVNTKDMQTEEKNTQYMLQDAEATTFAEYISDIESENNSLKEINAMLREHIGTIADIQRTYRQEVV